MGKNIANGVFALSKWEDMGPKQTQYEKANRSGGYVKFNAKHGDIIAQLHIHIGYDSTTGAFNKNGFVNLKEYAPSGWAYSKLEKINELGEDKAYHPWMKLITEQHYAKIKSMCVM